MRKLLLLLLFTSAAFCQRYDASRVVGSVSNAQRVGGKPVCTTPGQGNCIPSLDASGNLPIDTTVPNGPSTTISPTAGIIESQRPSVSLAVGSAPRILVISDSILNDSVLVTAIQTSLPNAKVVRRTIGGSDSSIGAFLAAGDVQIYGQAGNILPSTALAGTCTNCTMATVASPTTGRLVRRLTSTDNFNRIQIDFVVPAGAPDLTFSVEMEPGTATTTNVSLYNVTKAGSVTSAAFGADTLPRRYYLPAAASLGATYAAGDTLRIYMDARDATATGVIGTIYFAAPMVNVGGVPLVYHATSGAAEAVASAAWVNPTPGFRRESYDLAIVEFGRNDHIAVPSQVFGRSIEAIVSGAAQFASRVLVCSPPPLANAGLTDWEATDNFVSGGYLAAMKRAAARQGAGWYDAVTAYKALVTAGSYAVNQLMRDAVHPTIASAASPGIAQYASAIVALAGSNQGVPTKLAAAPVARIGGEPTSGAWAWKGFAYTGTATHLVDQLGFQPVNTARAFSTSGAGAITATVTGSNVGVIYLADAAAAGTFTVSVDGQPATTVNSVIAGLAMQPHGQILADDLPYGQHTVTITWVSGEARIAGVVGF